MGKEYVRKTKDVFVLELNYGFGWSEKESSDDAGHIRDLEREYKNLGRKARVKRKVVPLG